jgi:hypothetical protein
MRVLETIPECSADSRVSRADAGLGSRNTNSTDAVTFGMGSSPLRLVRDRITRAELAELAATGFGDMIKAVVDVQRQIMAIGGELHSDEEALLLDDGSLQSDLWGINLYPAEPGEGFIEFDSLINVRPSQGNPSRDVLDDGTRSRIRMVVSRLAPE